MWGGRVRRRVAVNGWKVWLDWFKQKGFVEGRGGRGLSPRSGTEASEAGWRVATACDGVVDGDGQVGAGVSYLRVGAVADCLTGLGWVASHGCSVVRWKSKATEKWKQLRVIGSGSPLRS